MGGQFSGRLAACAVSSGTPNDISYKNCPKQYTSMDSVSYKNEKLDENSMYIGV